jgi:NAD-specific glutamate dehydrogenase
MELGERRKRGQGLTRPELAVLLAYAKLSLYGDLLDSAIPDDPYLGRELARYFPSQLNERFPDALARHRLRREIISTQLTNSLINRGGPAFVARIADQTGAPAPTIAAAFFVARNSYDMMALNAAIDALDTRVAGSCSSISMRRSRSCCSTASSGSCAMSTCRRGWPRSSSTIVPASRRSRPRCTTRCPRAAGRRSRRARAS